MGSTAGDRDDASGVKQRRRLGKRCKSTRAAGTPEGPATPRPDTTASDTSAWPDATLPSGTVLQPGQRIRVDTNHALGGGTGSSGVRTARSGTTRATSSSSTASAFSTLDFGKAAQSPVIQAVRQRPRLGRLLLPSLRHRGRGRGWNETWTPSIRPESGSRRLRWVETRL